MANVRWLPIGIVGVATLYAIRQLAGLAVALDAGARVRRRRTTRCLRSIVVWELAISVCLAFWGDWAQVVTTTGVAGLVAFTAWTRRFWV